MRAFAIVALTCLMMGCSAEADGPTWTRHPLGTTTSRVLQCASAGPGRVLCDLVVPLGRTQDELLATAERAADEVAEQGACGVQLRLLRPGDAPGSAPAGRYTFAAGAEWEAAPQRCKPRLSLDRTGLQAPSPATGLYFDPPPRPGVGDRVRFVKAEGPVDVSRGEDDWGDDQVFARVPAGRWGKVVSVSYGPVETQDIGRIEVDVVLEGRPVRGWVHSYEVAPGP